MGWKVIISPSVRGDLVDIVGYISRHNADAAVRIGVWRSSRNWVAWCPNLNDRTCARLFIVLTASFTASSQTRCGLR